MAKEKRSKEAEEAAGEETPKKKKTAEDSEFRHRVRVAGVVLDGNQDVTQALTKIKGVGSHVSRSLIQVLDLKKGVKLGSLTEKQVEEIEKAAENLHDHLPAWMLNRRKDMESGKDLHRIGPDLDMTQREDINLQKKNKSYRGVRHSLNLRVRGQRTRSTGRTGTTVGVVRKKVMQAQAQRKKE